LAGEISVNFIQSIFAKLFEISKINKGCAYLVRSKEDNKVYVAKKILLNSMK
jgi:hypothetical protein